MKNLGKNLHKTGILTVEWSSKSIEVLNFLFAFQCPLKQIVSSQS